MLKKNQSPLIRSFTTALMAAATLGLWSSHVRAADSGAASGFLAFDKNQDGFIDAKEASANPMLLESFDAVDVDRDGLLSMEEFNKGFATK